VDLRTVALDAARDLEGKSPQEILRWAVDTFGDRFCVSSSMGDGVLSSLAASVKPGIDVLFLDTGYHFPETLGTRDAVAVTYDVNVRTVGPSLLVHEHEADFGKLYEIDPDMCCSIRKVWPLERAIAPYLAWAGGVRRAESPTRAATPVVAWDARRGKVKVNPLVAWSDQQVEDYVAEHDILVNPLRQIGYTSIGCAPCTRPVAPGEDPRSGRWAGLAKTECGLHA
jgi:phosphoadenosine phosphosulfate reductase